MLAFHLTRNAATATVLVAALTVGALYAGEAEAQSAPAPARFFTINEVLAKQEARRAGATGKVAAVDRHVGLSDAGPGARSARGPEPFGMYAFKAPDGELWTKWRRLNKDLAKEAALIEACRADEKKCTPEAKRFMAIVADVKTRTGRARFEAANRLVNDAIRYMSDQQQHGVPDRWTAPLATLRAKAGDCEDFAAAKYAALRAAGVAEIDMRLVLVHDTQIRIDHAVLAVRLDGEWMVLDNRKTFIADTSELKHYTPLFALDHEGVKLFATPYASWGEGAYASLGEGTSEFAEWTLRRSGGAEFGEWALRGSNAEPAAAN